MELAKLQRLTQQSRAHDSRMFSRRVGRLVRVKLCFAFACGGNCGHARNITSLLMDVLPRDWQTLVRELMFLLVCASKDQQANNEPTQPTGQPALYHPIKTGRSVGQGFRVNYRSLAKG